MFATSIYPASLYHPYFSPPARGFRGRPPNHFGHFGPPEVTFGGLHCARGGHAFHGRLHGAYPSAPEFTFGHGFPGFHTGDFPGMHHPHSIHRGHHSRKGFHTMRLEPCFPGHLLFPIESHDFEDRERAEDSSSPEFHSREFSCEFSPTAPGPAHCRGRLDGRNDCHRCAEHEHGFVEGSEFPSGREMRDIHGPHHHHHHHQHFHPYGGCRGYLHSGASRGRGLRGRGRGHAFGHKHSWCQCKLHESDPEIKGEATAEGKRGINRDAEKPKVQKDDDLESIENISVTSTIPDEAAQNDKKTATGKGKAREMVVDE
ncbi:hypothetical protein A7U60_g2047 [Sanghuangporus baumii]|uniref:Uncharacterized protein n=1 Tax=Sanghuangporus baumii TaxID=108892 RepID=A0A9Q5I306_SANBA|nr:hypothetical protein A7U60_g2047 [Sanghuangporus baumii]